MRNQLREYLTDATTSKLLLEEQTKRTEEYSEEIKALRAKMSTMVAPESAEEVQRKAEKINTALNEINDLRRVNDEAVKKCKELSGRIDALNDYIGKQGSEVNTLKGQLADKAKAISDQDKMISEMKNRIRDYQRENSQLQAQLESLKSRAARPAPQDDLDDFDMPNLSLTDKI